MRGMVDMKNILKYTVLAIMALTPRMAEADFDITTYLTRVADSAKRDGIGKVMKDQISGLQTDSMNLVNPDFSNIDPSNIKSAAMDAAKEASKKVNISDKLPGGLAGKINGTGSNPALEEAAKKEFTVSKRSGDDVKKNEEVKEKINDLMIENVSLLYARGLVRRYQLENEKVDEVEDFNNVNAVQSVFANTILRANNRWMSMLQSDSSIMVQTSVQQLNAIRLDEEEEETDEDNKGGNGDNGKGGDGNGGNQSGNNDGNNGNNGDNNGKDGEKKGSKLENTFNNVKNWAEDQGDKAGDWLNQGDGKNQEGVNKIINGMFGNDSDVGSALTKGTDYLSKRGTGDKVNGE